MNPQASLRCWESLCLVPRRSFSCCFILQASGVVFSKSQLYEAVWGIDGMGEDNTVMVHIRRIRERIEEDPSNPQYLLTVRGSATSWLRRKPDETAQKAGLSFTYQLIAFSAFMFCFLIVLLFFLIKHISEDEIKRNFPTGVLNSIVTETVTENGEVLLQEQWKLLLQEKDMWLQVVDMDGNVILSTNTTTDVPSEYSVSTLLEIKEERRLGEYTMDWQMDLTYEEPLLYLIGRIDEGSDHLRNGMPIIRTAAG